MQRIIHFNNSRRDDRDSSGPLATLDEPIVSTLLHSHSEHGFLSVYERVDYDDPARLRSHAHAGLLRILASLSGPEERQQRIRRAIALTQRTLDQLPIRPMRHRGIVGFVDADVDGHGMWIALDDPVLPSVTLGRYPRVEPLVEILESRAPVGVVRCTNDTIMMDEIASGRLVHCATFRVPPGEGSRLKQGPGTRTPGHMNESSVQHDLFARTMERYTRDALSAWSMRTIPDLVHKREWQRMVVWGPTPLTQLIKQAAGPGIEVVNGGSALLMHEPAQLLMHRVRALLAERDRERELDLVHNLVDGDRAAAVVGQPQTGRALGERRVANLVLADVQERDVEDMEALAWREEMLRHAANQQSEVTVVHGDAAQLLRSKGSVAAELRY